MSTAALYSYNEASSSAKALAEALGIKRIKHQGSKFKPAGKTVINWGSSVLPDNIEVEATRVLNDSNSVKTATNKLWFFQTLRDNPWVVPHTTDASQVRTWLADGKTVVARTKLTGHSGEGIVLIEGVDAEIVEAPLYTLYVPKKHEYRVHCFRKRVDNADNIAVFDIQQKKRKTDVEDQDVNWKIRNLDGGFIYAREDIDVPSCVEDAALEVFMNTGLDFGAVDIIYNESGNKAYALEINTAPGLTGTTLDKYVEAIGGLIKG